MEDTSKVTAIRMKWTGIIKLQTNQPTVL